jgi:hypothetical protein
MMKKIQWENGPIAPAEGPVAPSFFEIIENGQRRQLAYNNTYGQSKRRFFDSGTFEAVADQRMAKK